MEVAIDVLTTLTATVVEVTLPPGGFRSSGVYVNVRGPEAYTYHAKFLAESPDKYQEATRRALQGFAETNAAVYVQARRQVDLLRGEIITVFSRVDMLVVPTMLGEPITIADSAKVDAVDYRNTVPFNTYGLPAILFPVASHGRVCRSVSRSAAHRLGDGSFWRWLMRTSKQRHGIAGVRNEPSMKLV